MTCRHLYGFLGLLLCAFATFAADIPEYPFVFVVGHADIDTPPDIAVCSLTLHAIDPDPGKAESMINERLKSVLATLNANHVSPGDIESFSINKQILTNNEYNAKGPAAIRGYDLSRPLKFTVRQLDSLPVMESPMVGEPNIDNINCRFDRKDRKGIEADLLTKALQSARDQADKLAQPLGRRVTTAVAISKSPFDSIAASLGMGGFSSSAELAGRMFKKSAAPDTLLVPSTIAMSATVNVLFKME
ncbi:MAG: SIMPL domain-containing protein [Pseudomonadota bacterium]|nr:SIMPL domain-containing protein [Pseudomonadota bacterium]